MKINNFRVEVIERYEMIFCDLHLCGDVYTCAEYYDQREDSIRVGTDAHMNHRGIVNESSGKTIAFVTEGGDDGANDDSLFDYVRDAVVVGMRKFIDRRNAATKLDRHSLQCSVTPEATSNQKRRGYPTGSPLGSLSSRLFVIAE